MDRGAYDERFVRFGFPHALASHTPSFFEYTCYFLILVPNKRMETKMFNVYLSIFEQRYGQRDIRVENCQYPWNEIQALVL